MISNIFFILLLIVAVVLSGLICRADFRRRIIPDVYLFPLLLIGLVITNFYPWPITPGDGAIAAILGYVITAIIGYVFEKIKPGKTAPIGMGDIKLIAVVGYMVGNNGIGNIVNRCMYCRFDMGHIQKTKIHSVCTIFNIRWTFIFNYNDVFDIICQDRDNGQGNENINIIFYNWRDSGRTCHGDNIPQCDHAIF